MKHLIVREDTTANLEETVQSVSLGTTVLLTIQTAVVLVGLGLIQQATGLAIFISALLVNMERIQTNTQAPDAIFVTLFQTVRLAAPVLQFFKQLTKLVVVSRRIMIQIALRRV